MPRRPDALTPFRAPYAKQKHSAATREIAWEFDLESWAALWIESGRWEERGQRIGQYCMARLGDVGPYSPGNVRIILNAENGSEAFDHKPFLSRANVTSRPTGVGGGKGYYFREACTRRPWYAIFRGKRLGYFETEDEARAAYVAAADAYLKEHGLK